MKKLIYLLTVLLFVVSCSNDEILEQQTIDNQELLSRADINKIIDNSLETTGDFDWSKAEAKTIYSAVKLGDGILTIGYGNSSDEFAKSSTSKDLKDEILNVIYQTEELTSTKARNEAEIFSHQDINVFDVKIENFATVQKLLQEGKVRYIEPGDYQYFEQDNNTQARSSGSGCGYETATLATADYRTVSPGARVPWSFDAHNIPAAWNHSTGAGVTVAVVDSGLSPQQSLMNQDFNDGDSSGRFVQKYGTFVDSWWSWSNNYDGVHDKCGHGTSMASVATAPRNNNNLPVGVAYNANLVSYRAVENVIINDYHEKRGVSEALTALGKRSDVKVISMSIGSPFSIGKVKDAVKYAYGKGKMIIAAGGTSTSFTTWYGVIFPASMSETVAVTGVKEGQYNKCDVCHTGSAIDFTVQMQRTNGTSNKVPVLSYYNGQANYVGGSSVATATTAGIAALVWAKHPTWSRTQVLNKMKQSADFYPSKHSKYGYGNIDALEAVQ
ncbi:MULTISPECIES: S8 family peptidase [Tenacibaculum]|uniref:S8 family peptidase n=1 Tax=Tenacibaculum TaxID=104267 RepID=UPI001F0A6DB7|nr:MULTISPECIES: S8 family serine peptidase [Tenacibaculum]MCH3881849.1 S8 family serine peptidase [Tenacibaculum aquimarinum]MDO6598582.1 S8 family serine peptidase [Tenacibaculum sp. 1_MG-2023]